MYKILKSVGGFALMIIGIGGIKGDLQGWIDWLGIKGVNSDIWWLLLLGIGLLLLIFNLIPYDTRLKTIKKLPILKNIITKLPTDIILAFYSTRKSLNQKYGGIQEQLDNSKIIWAAWHGATVVATEPEERLRKVKKLILIHPESNILSMYSDSNPKGNVPDAQSDIISATEVFRIAGTEVKWFDGLFNLITISEPEKKRARARVEVWFFEETEKRQNYVIEQRTNKVAYKGIEATFNKMWNDERWCHKPPEDLKEFRKKLGHDILNS